MAKRDLMSDVVADKSLESDQRTAAADGLSSDLRGFDSAIFLLDVNDIGGTSTPTFTFECQESDNDSTWTAIAAADLDGTEPVVVAGNDNSLFRLGYRGTKRYVRWTLETVSGSSPTLDCCGIILKGHAHLKEPTT